jgi:hypothetical protein
MIILRQKEYGVRVGHIRGAKPNIDMSKLSKEIHAQLARPTKGTEWMMREFGSVYDRPHPLLRPFNKYQNWYGYELPRRVGESEVQHAKKVTRIFHPGPGGFVGL